MNQPIITRLVVPGWSDEDRAEVRFAVEQLREVLQPRHQSPRQSLTRAQVVLAASERLVGHLEWLLDRLAADHDADSSRSGAA